ncbi:MAG: helix-turn-helix transcriptional regulator [Proteobacteria bacterium]|nr:helix-turn-helix transcriptional regulator [Pseudomonadota bacterium]
MANSAQIVARAVQNRRLGGQPGGATLTTIAQGDGWGIADIVCSAGPCDARAEEQHQHVSLALVVAGAFTYRNSAGRANLQSGSILLGSVGACFSCGHEHGEGDRCIALKFAPAAYEQMLSLLAGPATRMSFANAALPACRETFSLFAEAEAFAAASSLHEPHEFALRVVSRVISILGERRGRDPAPTATQARAISAIARLVEENPGSEASLKTLAAKAGMSPFHFIRCFKRVIGMTPHAFVRATRLREAARLLRDPRLSIATIAFEAGFQDLSVFNAAFRQAFQMTPRTLRGSLSRG